MATTKITARVHPGLWEAFGYTVEALCLKKGAYLDRLIAQAGWRVFDPGQTNLASARGIVIREIPLPGYGSVLIESEIHCSKYNPGLFSNSE